MSLRSLDAQRYFESIDADTERLLVMADKHLNVPVPCCPGWTVADVVSHLATVYEHKVRVMADNAWPQPWPPEDAETLPPAEALAEAKARLFEEFSHHEVGDATTTFSAADTTIGFWVRRMALEVAVHRYDAELARADPTPIPDDIALDGVDEVLRVMLGGPWWDGRVATRHPVDAVVGVEAKGQRWLCAVATSSVAITGEDSAQRPSPAAVTICGDPESVFLWLWGRVGDERVAFDGDLTLGQEFRARLAECTG
jgi:uncharacterized protein (TIGR03083 family)